MKQTILFILSILILSSCNQGAEKKIPAGHEREITDMSGRKVIIPKNIKKIIALRSGALRLVTYMGKIKLVIGIEEGERRRNAPYLFAHPELRKLPIIGTGNAPEAELIAKLKPDLILCTHNTIGESNKLQKKTGVPVINIEYGDFNQNKNKFLSALDFLGTIFNDKEKANQLKEYIHHLITDLNERSKTSLRQGKDRVYIGGISYRGAHGITSTEPMYAPFRLLNASNVAASLGEVTSSPKAWLKNAFIDKEQLIKWNPDKIFLDVSGFELTKKDIVPESVLTKLLDALRDNEIYMLIPHNWYDINYENIFINAYYIGKVLYPDTFNDIDLYEKANEIYKKFLGKSVYNEIVNKIGGCGKYEEKK